MLQHLHTRASRVSARHVAASLWSTHRFASSERAPQHDLRATFPTPTHGHRKFKSIFFKRTIVVSVCSYSASWNTTRPTAQSECLAIRCASSASILLPGPACTKHVAAGSEAKASATTATQSAHPPTSMADRTAKERSGEISRSARIMMGTAPSPARNKDVSLSSCSFCEEALLSHSAKQWTAP